jgi:hypothetical protein
MTDIVVFATNAGVPATGLSPTLDVWRVADGVQQVTAQAMAEVAGGWYRYTAFSAVDGSQYVWAADLTATLANADRYKGGAFSGTTETRLETDIPAILADTADIATQPYLGVAYAGGTNTLALAVHAERANTRVTPTGFSLTLRDQLGATVLAITQATGGVTLEPEDNAYRYEVVQVLTDGVVYRAEVSVTDATGTIGPRLFTIGKQ